MNILGRFTWFALGVAVTLFTLAVIATADAGVLKGDKENCAILGHYAEYMIEARTGGAEWEDVSKQIEEDIKESLASESGIIQDQDDAAYARTALKGVWDDAKVSSMEAGWRVMLACLKAKSA